MSYHACFFTAPIQPRWSRTMEINPALQQLQDLRDRAAALRGYL